MLLSYGILSTHFSEDCHSMFRFMPLWIASVLAMGFVLYSSNVSIYVLEGVIIALLLLIGVGLTYYITDTTDSRLELDTLTGLPSRSSFISHLDKVLRSASYEKETPSIAVLIMDLDSFKAINDSMGHTIGDELLNKVAKGLIDLGLPATIYRLGGDEFGLFINLKQISIQDTCKTITTFFRSSIDVNKRTLFVSSSIGVSLFPVHGVSAVDLLRCADMAMYIAKKDSKIRYVIYEKEFSDLLVDRYKLTTDLHTALHNDQFVLAYQLKKNIKTSELVGLEALIRWQHPLLGLLYPDSFIDLAEKNNLILPMTLWAIKQGLKDLSYLGTIGFFGTVSINISPYCVFEESDIDEVLYELNRNGLLPEKLILEITEAATSFSDSHFVSTLTKFNKAGVKLSIDDFGTGRSSLLYLKSLPIAELKVDKSFVIPMLLSDQDFYIVQSVVKLAEGMQCVSVAEGVETPEIESALWEMGCTIAQGYHVSKPIPLAALEKRLLQELKI